MRRVLFFGLLLGGCISEPGSPEVNRSMAQDNAAERAPLSGDALRALLSDAYVTAPRSTDVVIDHPSGEVFFANGAYQRILGRARLDGKFQIRDSLVCIEGADFVRQCRQVIRRGGDTYLLVDQSDRSQTLVTITPLK